MWVLEFEPVFSARAKGALNLQVTSPALKSLRRLPFCVCGHKWVARLLPEQSLAEGSRVCGWRWALTDVSEFE